MPAQDPNIGRDILDGQFQILQKIGSGGMGAVYKAAQPAMNRMVAVKILHPKLTNRKDLVSRFRREARAMSHLEHPNTVKVLLFGELDDGSLYIVMEYLEGQEPEPGGPQGGPARARARGAQCSSRCCGALQEAHLQGIIHRDLKPENIFLSTNGGLRDYPKVLDFGLAKVTERELRPGSIMLTQEGMVFGTPEFMSPEQAQGKVLDARSDIYSLAVILYEVLTGKLPFDAKTPMEYIQAHVTKAPIPLDERVPGKKFPHGLGLALLKALEKAPEKRFGSAAEFAQALKPYAGMAGKGFTAMMPRGTAQQVAQVHGDPRRRAGSARGAHRAVQALGAAPHAERLAAQDGEHVRGGGVRVPRHHARGQGPARGARRRQAAGAPAVGADADGDRRGLPAGGDRDHDARPPAHPAWLSRRDDLTPSARWTGRTMPTSDPPAEKPRRRWVWLKRAAVAALLLALAGVLAVVLVVRHFEADLPSIAELESYDPPQVTRVLARDGTVLGEVFLERRTLVPIDAIPIKMKLAALAAEDATFFEHAGLNYLGMLRALLKDLTGHTRQGGSTITQQVIKNMLLTPERTLGRKVREAILARRIEAELTKDEILGLYLNHIYFGHGRYGVEEAARYYFGKSIRDVSLGRGGDAGGDHQGAAGVLAARRPRAGAGAAGVRARPDGAEAASRGPTRPPPPRARPSPSPPSRRLAPSSRPRSSTRCGAPCAPSSAPGADRGGYTVTTTIDPALEAAARAAVRRNVDDYEKRHKLAAAAG